MKRRESILLILFFGTLLVLGGFLGFDAWNTKMAQMRGERDELQIQAELQEDFLERYGDELRAKERWLAENAGSSMPSDEASTRLLNLANATAGALGLSLSDARFLPPGVDRRYHTARLAANVNGSEESVYRWLAEFHDPTALRAVETLRIRPDRDDISIVNCEVTLALWYLPTEEERLEALEQIGQVLNNTNRMVARHE